MITCGSKGGVRGRPAARRATLWRTLSTIAVTSMLDPGSCMAAPHKPQEHVECKEDSHSPPGQFARTGTLADEAEGHSRRQRVVHGERAARDSRARSALSGH